MTVTSIALFISWSASISFITGLHRMCPMLVRYPGFEHRPTLDLSWRKRVPKDPWRVRLLRHFALRLCRMLPCNLFPAESYIELGLIHWLTRWVARGLDRPDEHEKEVESSLVLKHLHPCRENSSLACQYTALHLTVPVFCPWWLSQWSPQLSGVLQTSIEAILLIAILYSPLVLQSTHG